MKGSKIVNDIANSDKKKKEKKSKAPREKTNAPLSWNNWSGIPDWGIIIESLDALPYEVCERAHKQYLR